MSSGFLGWIGLAGGLACGGCALIVSLESKDFMLRGGLLN
jgi:hypothetical protein